MNFMMKKGSFYLKYNGNLLIYGCIFVDENGNMEMMMIEDKLYVGCELFDVFEWFLWEVFVYLEEIDDLVIDMVWYLWIGEYFFFFGKCVMIIFECYFIKEKEMYKEKKNLYYYLCEDEVICWNILVEFGFNLDYGYIINGYIFVKEIEGEDLIKVNGKMIVIDGGFFKVY